MTARTIPLLIGRVDIWLLAESEGPSDLDTIRLDREEEARAARMATAELRDRSRRRRRFLRAVLARHLGLSPETVPLAIDAGGKPHLAAAMGIHFNLSHSGDVSVLAVGSSPLGVDVERRKSFDRLTELMRYACSPRERALIAAAPDATAAFLDRWVLKEAILKCRGSGLVENLGDIDPGPISASPTSWKELTLQLLRPPPGIAETLDLHLALAAAGQLADITWHRYPASATRPPHGDMQGWSGAP